MSADTINAVIILTDGQDADSTVSLNNLQKQLKTSDFSTDTPIAFFTVGYGNKGDFSPEVLLKIAEKNGGYYRHGDPETISTLMSDLQFEF